MNGLARLACGWWWMVGVRPRRGGARVALVLQYDPEDVLPGHGHKVLEMSACEADDLGRRLREAAAAVRLEVPGG